MKLLIVIVLLIGLTACTSDGARVEKRAVTTLEVAERVCFNTELAEFERRDRVEYIRLRCKEGK